MYPDSGNQYDDENPDGLLNRLSQAEEAPSDDTNTPETEDNDVGGLNSAEKRASRADDYYKKYILNGKDEDAYYKQFILKGKKKASKKGGKFVGGGIIGVFLSGVMAMIAIVVILLVLIGPYKEVHFATIARSAGMIRFSYQMNRQFANISFNAATLTDTSTGNIKLGNRSLIDVLRGVNPQKQLTILGKEGTVKFNFETTCGFACLKTKSNLRGVVINGQEFSVDKVTQEGFGKNFNELSAREKVYVRNEFSKQMGAKLSERLSLENRAFRSSVFNGLRKVTGISMTKWANKARDYVGKKPEEAKAKNVKESIERVGEDGARSVSAQAIEDGVEAAKDPSDPVKAAKAAESRKLAGRMADTAGKASLVVLAATVSCIIHDLSNSFAAIHDNYEQKVDRVGHDALTTADQIKSGETTGEAIGAENALWDNAENSVMYKQATGQVVDTNDYTSQLMSIPGDASQTTFAKIISAVDSVQFPAANITQNIPVLGDLVGNTRDLTCKVVLNPGVQWTIAGADLAITAVASFFTAGGAGAAKVAISESVQATLRAAASATAGLAVGEILGRIIDSAVGNLTSFTGAETGANRFNVSMVGVNSMEQTLNRQTVFGAPLTTEEAQASDKVAMEYQKDTYKEGSATNRYFAISNPYSLTSKLLPYIPSSTTQMASSLPKMLSSIFSAPAVLFGNLFGGQKVAAAATSTTDFSGYTRQWGWTEEEYNITDNDSSYSDMQELTDYYAAHLDDKDGANNLYSQINRCYTPVLQKDIPDYCTADYLRTPAALHWRQYQSMMYGADSLSSDDLGVRDAVDQPSVTASGDLKTATSAELKSSSVDIPCAEGTTDVGIQDGYADGNLVKIRVCAIPGLPSSDSESRYGSQYYVEGAGGMALVNSRASASVLTMVTTMKAAGLDIAVTSSFRTYAHQAALRKELGTTAAVAGKSNHQLGLAIDWRIDPGRQSKDPHCKRVAGMCQPPVDVYGVFEWLTNNAGNYGYTEYSEEFWHWEAKGV